MSKITSKIKGLFSSKPSTSSTSPPTPTAAEEILGALATSPAFASYVARRNTSPIVRKQPLTKARNWVMGFGPAVIPPHQTSTISAQSRCLFRGEKLIETGDKADIINLFVGRKRQDINGLTGDIISAKSIIKDLVDSKKATSYNYRRMLQRRLAVDVDKNFNMDTCHPALMMTFQVQNSTAATITWAASIIGKAVM